MTEDTRPGGRVASLARSMIWFAASYAVAVVGYLAVTAVASRLIGLDRFGLYLVILTSTSMVAQLGLLGVHRSGLREAARLDGPRAEHRAELTALRDGVLAVSLIGLPVAGALTGAVSWLLLGADRGDATVAVLAGVLVHLTGQQKVCAHYLRGLGHVRFAGTLDGRSGGALVAVVQAVLITTVWLAWPGLGLEGALVATAVGYAVPLLPAYLVLGRHWGPPIPPRRPLSVLAGVVRRDWKFSVAQTGGMANSAIDLWLCALWLPAASTSLFGAAQRLSQLVLIPSTTLATVFSPAVSRLHAKGDRGRLQRVVRTGTTVALAGSALLTLPLLVAPGAVLQTVFGEVYVDATPVLLLLAVGYLMNAVSGLSGVTLSMSHHEGKVAAVQWLAVAMRAIACTVGALLGGLVGLAAASASCTIVFYACMWWQARRHVGVVTHATPRPELRLLTQVRG